MVITVQIPKKTMHHKLVCEPSHELHKEECGDNDERIGKHNLIY
jgi:hypothetical protein